MKSFKSVANQAEMSTFVLETALRAAQNAAQNAAQERRRLRSLTLCGTVAGVVTVVGQLRTDWPECQTVSQLLEKLSWGASC